MKLKLKNYAIVLILALALLATVLNTQVFATEISDDEADAIYTSETENTEDVDEEDVDEEDVETYEGDLYVIFSEDDSYDNSTYVMDKYVDGNVFIVGENVQITGWVNGSLFVIASNVVLDEDAYIGCHIFALADTITMSGFTYDMYAACNSFTFTNESVIYRDLRLSANSAKMLGSVGRDIYVSADEITVYDGEAAEGLYIAGDLNYTSSNEINDLDLVTINGEVTFTQGEATTSEDVIVDYIYDGIENTVFAIVVYVVLIFLAPKFVEKSKEYVSTRALLSGVVGFAFTILLPIVALLVLCIEFGIAISITMIMAYVIILMINSSIVTIAINEFVANKIASIDKTWKKVLMIIPVSIVMFLVRQIPYVGGLVTAIILFVGVGIVVLYQFDKRKKEIVSEE